MHEVMKCETGTDEEECEMDTDEDVDVEDSGGVINVGQEDDEESHTDYLD